MCGTTKVKTHSRGKKGSGKKSIVKAYNRKHLPKNGINAADYDSRYARQYTDKKGKKFHYHILSTGRMVVRDDE